MFWLKDYRFVGVDQHAIFGMLTYRFGQYTPFDIAPLANQIFDGVAVIAVNDILGNNWPLIQILRYIVCRCADQLHAPLKGTLIRFSSHESRQETVMNVDDLLAICLHNKWL